MRLTGISESGSRHQSAQSLGAGFYDFPPDARSCTLRSEGADPLWWAPFEIFNLVHSIQYLSDLILKLTDTYL